MLILTLDHLILERSETFFKATPHGGNSTRCYLSLKSKKKLTHSKMPYLGFSSSQSLPLKVSGVSSQGKRPPSSTECFERLSHAVVRSADFAATNRSRLRRPAGTGSVRLTQSEEDTIVAGGFLEKYFLQVFSEVFWRSSTLLAGDERLKQGRQVGRLVGVELGL